MFRTRLSLFLLIYHNPALGIRTLYFTYANYLSVLILCHIALLTDSDINKLRHGKYSDESLRAAYFTDFKLVSEKIFAV